MTSLQEVADLAGVSRGTASYALTGKGRVAAATRARVQEAAKALNYRANLSARNLRRARTGALGLYLPRGLGFLDFYMNLTFGFVDALQESDVTVAFIPASHDPLDVISLHVDGFAVVDVSDDDPLAIAILSSGKPVVSSEAVPAGLPQPRASVISNHFDAMWQLLEHISRQGASHLAVISGDMPQEWIREVNRAASEWSAKSPIPCDFFWISEPKDISEMASVTEQLIKKNPHVDAIVCVPDGTAIGVVTGLANSGMTVPGDVTLASYIDSAVMQVARPSITAIDLKPRELGRSAALLLHDILERDDKNLDQGPQERNVIIDLNLIPRESTRGKS